MTPGLQAAANLAAGQASHDTMIQQTSLPVGSSDSSRDGGISPAVIAAAGTFVRQELSGNDGSHDYHHVDRVRRCALTIAEGEGVVAPTVLRLIEVAALLHDVKDWKYYKGQESGAAAATIEAFLLQHGVAPATCKAVLDIIACVGFKEELGGAGRQLSQEACIVQDADRLDAIGAIGVARCFTFGGRFHRTLHDPQVAPREGLTKQAYMAEAQDATTLNHFYEKLLKLKDLMKTGTGRRLATARHAFMQQYLDQFHAEWSGIA